MKGTALRALAAGIIGMTAFCTTVQASDFPTRPITVVVPFAAGGPTDTSARAFTTALAEEIGKAIVVENVPGAGGSIGTSRVSTASPDGYTLLWGTGSALSILPNLRELSYDPAKSFAPISMILSAPFILAVNPSLQVNTLEQFVELAKSKPGELNYSSTGTGGTAHMIGEMFGMRTEIDAVHVPYNGGAPMMHALVAGDVDYAFDTPTTIAAMAADNRIVPLAVTSLKRWPALPELRTLDEAGYEGFDATTWFGLLAPANTPKDRVDLLSAAVQKVLSNDDMRNTLSQAGFFIEGSTPDEFAAKMADDNKLWADIIKRANISIQ